MNYLSIATIGRKEGPYIQEWVKYHLGIGVDYIYFFDNDTPDDDGNIKALSIFPGKQVAYIPFQGQTMQTRMTEYALSTYRNDTRWLAFIDVDEFLVPLKTDNMHTFLKDYEQYPAVCPHWRLFGSSGHLHYEARPVLERFTRRAAEVDRHIKSIVDPKRTGRWVTVHKYTHIGGNAVDEHANPIAERESRPEPATADLIQLNHYVVKSFEECTERRNRLRADIPEKHKMPEFFYAHDKNEVEDLRASELYKKYATK